MFTYLHERFSLSCTKKEEAPIKPEANLKGDFKGTATNQANSADKKALSLSITSSDNPMRLVIPATHLHALLTITTQA